MSAKSICRQAGAWVAVLLLCAGIARAQAQSAQPPVAVPVAPEANPQPSVNYQMQAKDTVHIRVFQEDDLETTARIDKDGNIFFPLLGKAQIGGQTVQEATTTMETLLRKYLINPQVAVEITSYAKQHFTILGQVNKPGIYDIPDESSLNLLEALGMAGGYTKIANPSKITVKRVVNGAETVIKIDGKRLVDPRNGSEPVFQVESGDTIIVGEAIF